MRQVAHAQAQVTLTSEFLSSFTPATLGTYDPAGDSVHLYHDVNVPGYGPVAGPVGQFRALIEAYESTFTITGPAGTVTGEATLDINPNANCGGRTATPTATAAQIIASDLSYTATINPAT